MNLNDARFLYIEDDPMSRQVMQMIFESVLGVNTLAMLEDSREFLPRIQGLPESPTVFLLDIQMHPLSGFDMLELIRRDPQLADRTVIALTASVMSDEIQRMRDAGFDGAISKPISATTFPDLIRQIVNGEPVWHIG